MVIDFTKAEIKAFDALEESYNKLIEEAKKKTDSLRPDPYLPDETELQEQRPTPPPMPEPIKVVDDEPIYSKEDLDAYYDSEEYKTYAAENKRINDAIEALFENWYNAGSQEWKNARAREEELMKEFREAREKLYKKAEDRQFKALGSDEEAIFEDACKQVDRLIIGQYNYYDQKRAECSFQAVDVRALENGLFRLDRTETRKNIKRGLERHYNALSDEKKQALDEHIDSALASSPFVSDSGKRFGMVERIERPEITKEKDLTVTRPRNYKRPNTKAHNLLFKNELTTESSNHFEPVGLNKQKSVVIYANFVLPKFAQSLGLDAYDERVYAGVASCLFAGNNFIPWTMLYNRGVLGLSPRERNKEVTPSIKQDLINSLSLFDGRIKMTTDPTGEHKNDPNFDYLYVNEPLLFYQIREERVHGQLVEGIAIPSGYVPIGYRYAEMNGNELQTDRIESIRVTGLNYTRENIAIANTIYTRIKEIQYKNDRKRYNRELPENQRTITYEFVSSDFPTMSPTERNRLKKKIDACLKDYQRNGLFERYEHKRDKTKSFYAVVLYFEKLPRLTE